VLQVRKTGIKEEEEEIKKDEMGMACSTHG
jgi:hypothetical protein